MTPAKKLPFDLDAILTLEQAAEWLQLTPRYLQDQVIAGKIPCMRPTREIWRFHPRTVLEAFKPKK